MRLTYLIIQQLECMDDNRIILRSAVQYIENISKTFHRVSNLLIKTQYFDKLTNYRRLIFASIITVFNGINTM